MSKENILKENIYVYNVEYYCEEKAQSDYKEHKKKYPEIVDMYDYLTNYEGYIFALKFSGYLSSKQEARKLAKGLSKKNKEMACVRRYYAYINCDNKIDFELDEHFDLEEFLDGKKLT